MSIKQAVLSDLGIVKNITEITISEVYPHYYPRGAVAYFLEHHSETNIVNDIKQNQVFLCLDTKNIIVGTVTIKANEICRLFVLPQYQKDGYGTELLDYAENIILQQYSKVILAASLPAKSIYHKRGYIETEFHVMPTEYHDFLCYDMMVKELKTTVPEKEVVWEY